ncbi:hypothetical protein FACS189476_07970 [Spirochaetia bacterium]|nr:hypothetical protein FACS189476_07970 [Spirochaetia bacterium]
MKKSLHILAIIAAGAMIMGCASAAGIDYTGAIKEDRSGKTKIADTSNPGAVVAVLVSREIAWVGQKEEKGLGGLLKAFSKSDNTNEQHIADEAEKLFTAALTGNGFTLVSKDSVLNSAAYQKAKANSASDAFIAAEGYKGVFAGHFKDINKTFAKDLSAELGVKVLHVLVVEIKKATTNGNKGSLATGDLFPVVSVRPYGYDAGGKTYHSGWKYRQNNEYPKDDGGLLARAIFGSTEEEIADRARTTKITVGKYDEAAFAELVIPEIEVLLGRIFTAE